MADICDAAENEIAAIHEYALAKASRGSHLVSTGFCHYCGEGVTAGRLYCDGDCQSDHEREQELKRRAGR